MLSIIIPWCDRAELKMALPSILENIQGLDADITIVNLGGDKENLKQQTLVSSDINIINISKIPNFNKSIAQNIGAKYTTKPYIFFCDCDIIFPTGLIKELLDLLRKDSNSFLTVAQVKETEVNSRNAKNITSISYNLELKIKDGTTICIKDSEENSLDGIRNAPGLLMVKRSDFEKINGFNSEFDGWGWEDQDVICRLVLYAKLKYLTFGMASHISHNDNVRMKLYTQKYNNRWHSRDVMFRKALNNYDEENFMGTYKQDCMKIVVD